MYFLIVTVSINISCFLLPTTIKQKPLPSNFVPFSGCVCDIIDDLLSINLCFSFSKYPSFWNGDFLDSNFCSKLHIYVSSLMLFNTFQRLSTSLVHLVPPPINLELLISDGVVRRLKGIKSG